MGRRLLALAALLMVAAPACADAVIKGGTLIITPGAAVEGNIAHIRTLRSPAGLAVDCPGGTTYALTTGAAAATCNARTADDGSVQSARCEDASGNLAALICSEDGGRGACGETAGSGRCTAQ